MLNHPVFLKQPTDHGKEFLWTSVDRFLQEIITLCGPFPSGDNYTRFPEVEILKSIGHTSVIRRLDKIFATHGIPAVAKSDNGPPFNGTKFENFAKYQRINASLHTGPSPMEKPNDL